jgi:hypothetical protein
MGLVDEVPWSLFPPFALARPSISIHDGNDTTCQEHHCHNYGEIKVVLGCQCASCMFIHRP